MKNIALGDIVVDGDVYVYIHLIPTEQFRDELCRWNGLKNEDMSLDMVYSFYSCESRLSMYAEDGEETEGVDYEEKDYIYPPSLLQEAMDLVTEKYGNSDFREVMGLIGFMEAYEMTREEAEKVIYFSRSLPEHFDVYSLGLADGSYSASQLLTLWELSNEITRDQLYMLTPKSISPDTMEFIGDLFGRGMTVQELCTFMDEKGIQNLDQFQEQEGLSEELLRWRENDIIECSTMYMATMDSESQSWMSLGRTEEEAKEALRIEWNKCQKSLERNGYKNAETFSTFDEMDEEYTISIHAIEVGTAISW